MKILVMVTLAAAEVRAGAAGGGAPERKVAVCIGQGPNAPEVYRARLKASEMYEEIGLRIEWHPNGRDCRLASGAMEISFSYDTPANQFGKALAYSLPWEGTHVVVFYDRLKHLVEPSKVSDLLAHVLAHEIAHILEGTGIHAVSGVIKAVWDSDDCFNMSPKHLAFTEEDVLLIHDGLDLRASGRRAKSLNPRAGASGARSFPGGSLPGR
jgi:hypothetical protein